MQANKFYISSGAKNAQYTLRARFEDFDHNGRLNLRDQYICNLGTDINRAKEKAAIEAGEPVEVVPFELNPYGHKTEAELEAEARSIAWKQEYENNQARLAIEAAEIVRRRRAENALSQWQGEVGGRITRKITCLRWTALGQGVYGMRYVAIFRDEKMNKYVFFGGCVSSLPAMGEAAEVTFTVKEHSEYDETKQTIINRPKMEKKP